MLRVSTRSTMLGKLRCAMPRATRELMASSASTQGSHKSVSSQCSEQSVVMRSLKSTGAKVRKNRFSRAAASAWWCLASDSPKTTPRLYRGALSRRAYATDEKGDQGASDKTSEKPVSGPAAGKGLGSGAKKVGGTSSTLSNLENLYAAFAKQQKEKAKFSDTNLPRRDAKGAAPTWEASAAAAAQHAKDSEDTTLATAAEIQLDADIPSRAPLPPGLGDDDLTFAGLDAINRRGSDMPNLMTASEYARYKKTGETGEKGEDDYESLVLNTKARLAKEKSAQALLREKRPRTLVDLETLQEAEEIAAGRMDPTSPEALERKRRSQPIRPRNESEAQTIEKTLIARHKTAVEQVSHVEKELDLSATVPGMAPLTHSQNPYLYNEGFALGLTGAELEFLQTRNTWISLVDAKRTNVALQQRDMQEDITLVDDLFIRVVNTLSEGPSSGTWIHPEDLKAQARALAARDRLKQKLLEIYTNRPVQWATILHKYMPTPIQDKMAEKVLDRDFWTPGNPWLLAAFTKQIIHEAQMMEKMAAPTDLEEEIKERLLAQGQMRDDEKSDSVFLGPLGQSSGLTNEEENAAFGGAQEQEQQLVGCLFCSEHRHRFPLEPMNVPLLARHMNSSGRILPRKATGLCRRHQAKMSRAIKQARHMNLFTYKRSEYVINNVFKSPSTWDTPDLAEEIYTDPLKKIKKTGDSDEAFVDAIERDSPGMEHWSSIREHQLDDKLSAHLARDQQEEWSEALNDTEDSDNLEIMGNIEEMATGSRASTAKMKLGVDSPASATPDIPTPPPPHKSKRDRRSPNAIIDESGNDAIGDAMVAAALQKGARTARHRARREKDSL